MVDQLDEPERQAEACGGNDLTLHRWQVSFASGRGWYPVGEFVALNSKSAIDRAVEIFGAASDYRAQEIPWDAAPLAKPNPPFPRLSQ
jgi:hypothetical protein